MKASRILFVALALSVACLSTPVTATSVTTDQSDLWWNANEPGWGIQMVQRDQAIFATIYVYYTDDTPYWYTALMNYQGNFIWTGDLYLSNGSWFGTVPYNPSMFVTQKVGTMTWNAPFVNSGTLIYTVNGVQVSKNLTRFHLATDNFNGTYLGGIYQVVTGCFNPSMNTTAQGFVTVAVAQSGAGFQMTLTDPSSNSCTFSGTLSQAGQFGSASGSFTCNTGGAGTFNLYEVSVGVDTLSTRLSIVSSVNGCTNIGYFGGARSH